MFYSIKNEEDFENLNELISLQDQVKALGLQYQLGEQNFHEGMEKELDPVTETIRDVSEDVTRTETETSFENSKALSNFKKNIQK